MARVALLLAVIVVACFLIYRSMQHDPEPPAPIATGAAQIDANPWGEVQWIRNAEGATMPLGDVRTTPLRISLPAGTYRARVAHPPTEAAKECELAVVADQPAICWLDLAPTNAEIYFERIGW